MKDDIIAYFCDNAIMKYNIPGKEVLNSSLNYALFTSNRSRYIYLHAVECVQGQTGRHFERYSSGKEL